MAPITKMKIDQKQIEHKTVMTLSSVRVFNDLLARNLSKRLESSENEIKDKPLNTRFEKIFQSRCYNIVFEDFPDSNSFECKKLTSFIPGSAKSETKTDRKHVKLGSNLKAIVDTGNKSRNISEELLNSDLQIENFETLNFNPCFGQSSIITRSKPYKFLYSDLPKTDSSFRKKHSKFFRKSQFSNNLKLTPKRSLSLSSTNNSDFRFDQTCFAPEHRIIENLTFQNNFNLNMKHFEFENSIKRICAPIFPSAERMTKYKRKYKPMISENYSNANIDSKEQLIEETYGVQYVHEMKRKCTEPKHVGHFTRNGNTSSTEENSLHNRSNCKNELSDIIASLFVPLSNENNMEINPILKNNNAVRIQSESEMSKLKLVGQNLGKNMGSPENVENKNNSLKRSSNSVMFNSHPSKRRNPENVVYLHSSKVTNSEDEFDLHRRKASQKNTNNLLLRAAYPPDMPKGTRSMNESYEMIDLWSYNCPSLDIFTTEETLFRNHISRITRMGSYDQKLNKKSFVALRRLPEMEAILKYRINYSYYALSLNLRSVDVKQKTKMKKRVAQTINKQKECYDRKKEWYDDHKNISVALTRDYPIVLLTPIDISLLRKKLGRGKSTPLTVKGFGSAHACSNDCECFQTNPIVILTRMDALIHDKSGHKVQNSDNECIIDLTDTS